MSNGSLVDNISSEGKFHMKFVSVELEMRGKFSLLPKMLNFPVNMP